MSSRLLVYAKLFGQDLNDAFYSRQFYRETLIGIKHGLRALPDEQKPWVMLQCALSNPLDTSPDINPVHQYLPCNPFRLPTARDLAIADLFDREKVRPVEENELASVRALRAFVAAATPRSPLGDADTLVLWGHGSGKRVLIGSGQPHYVRPTMVRQPDFDLPRVTIPPAEPASGLGPEELRQALAGHRLGLLVLQSCRSASLEMAEMLTGVARYMLVSPQTVYAADWRYDTWLAEASAWNKNTSPKKRGEQLVSVVRALRRPHSSIALLELPWITLVAHRLDRLMPLVQSHLTAVPAFAKTLEEVTLSAHAYDSDSPDEIAVDMHDYAKRMAEHADVPDAIRTIAARLATAIDSSVVAHYIPGERESSSPLRGLTLALSRRSFFPLREPNQNQPYIAPRIADLFLPPPSSPDLPRKATPRIAI